MEPVPQNYFEINKLIIKNINIYLVFKFIYILKHVLFYFTKILFDFIDIIFMAYEKFNYFTIQFLN